MAKRAPGPSRDGKFTVGQAARNFGRGAKKVVTDVVGGFRNHPVVSTLATAGIVTGSLLFPPFAAAVGVAGMGLALYRTGKGVYEVVKDLNHHRPDAAERAFIEVGAGLTNVGLAEAAQGVQGLTALEALDDVAPIVAAITKPTAPKTTRG